MICKVIAIIIELLMEESIKFHDALHGFRMHRGTGTATLEAKLLQNISSMRLEVLYDIFVYIHKAYENLDWVHSLVILEGYGVSPQVFSLLN